MFTDSWNVIDILMILTLGFTYFLRWTFWMSDVRLSFDPFTPEYIELSSLAGSYTNTFIGDSTTVLVLVVKALKYFALQKDLWLLQKTLVQAIRDLVVFIALLVVLFMGFVLMGYNIFGMQVQCSPNPSLTPALTPTLTPTLTRACGRSMIPQLSPKHRHPESNPTSRRVFLELDPNPNHMDRTRSPCSSPCSSCMQAKGYRSIDDTIGTLFLILLGEFDFDEMKAVHAQWALVCKPRALKPRTVKPRAA